jgi:hypothetical protein
MKLYAVDYHLVMAQYQLFNNNFTRAQYHRNKAQILIEETGYHLRDKDLAE